MAPIRCSDNLQLERSNYRSNYIPRACPSACYPSPPPSPIVGPGIENFCRFPSFRPAASLLSSHPLLSRLPRSPVRSRALCKLKTESDWRRLETPSRAESSLKHMKGVATSPTDARNERKKTKERVRSFLFLSYSRSLSLSPFLRSRAGGDSGVGKVPLSSSPTRRGRRRTRERNRRTDGRTDRR